MRHFSGDHGWRSTRSDECISLARYGRCTPKSRQSRRCSRGWRNQQLSRNLRFETIESRIRQVKRFIKQANEYPWNWTVAMVDEFFGDLRSIHGLAQSSIRSYQVGRRQFCSYVSTPDYGWDRVCEKLFGTHPWPGVLRLEYRPACAERRISAEQAGFHQTRTNLK